MAILASAALWLMSATAVAKEPPVVHAHRLMEWAGKKVEFTIDPALGHPEAFRLEGPAGARRVVAGGPGGVLYGVQQALAAHPVVDADGRPDFDVRGTVLMMLSPSWNYQSDLSPEIYPWFYDRPLMARYLDHLLAARLNTLILWSGHLFPHILELPEYPDASQFSREHIRRNQEQFRWLAEECAKRNITILTHFYNIHISEHQAKALGRQGNEAARFTEPDDWVRGYYRKILLRYFEEFPNVGLYICPGESLDLAHQVPWFRDVVFRAARDSGKKPRLILRDWTMADDFRAALPSLYDNLWSELKHNDETITSPWPDERHEKWKGVLPGHIVNLHDPADAVPYRVGSPRLLGEMVRHWKDAGYFTGSWFYPPQAWVWPGTLDIVDPVARRGSGGIPPVPPSPGFGVPSPGRATGNEVPKFEGLLAWERDELWHLLEGRYLWRTPRDAEAGREWAAAWLGRKFGDAEAGQLLVDWYDVTGPILPGLQNLTAVRFGNFFPVSIGWVQAQVDDILSYRTAIDDVPLGGPTGLTRQRYYSRPVDEFTIERYEANYQVALSGTAGKGPARPRAGYEERRSMPVAQLAAELAAGRSPDGVMRADRLIDLYLVMAQESLSLAKRAAARPVNDPAEVRRFVQDSECLVLTVEFYRHKVHAALHKRLLELTNRPEHAAAFRAHLEASVPAYVRMMEHAKKFYRAGSSMWDAKPWERCLEEKVKPDYEVQLKWLQDRGAGAAR